MKILVTRFSSIGDIVLCTPAVRCLSEQVANAEIHFVTKPAYTSLLQENPYITKVWGYEDTSENVTALRKEKFDHIIDLHNNLRSRLLSLKLGVKTSRFNKINRQKWLAVQFKKTNLLPSKHIVERYLDATRFLNVHDDGKGLDYFIPPPTELPVEVPASGYTCMAIGGQHATKKLPVAKLIELSNSTKDNIIIIGGPEDSEAGESIAQKVPSVTNLCGKISINQSALIMKHAKAVVTHDTGMMHIAAALQKPIISIWGNTIPEFGMYPYKPDVQSKIFEIPNLPCRPCSKIGFEACPKGHFRCMNEQNTVEIAHHINSIK